MKLVVMPFNDYKKGEQQGFRDRDNHFLEILIERSDMFQTLLIIDRPVSISETISRRRSWCVKQGVTVLRGFNWKLSKLRENVYVLSYLELSVLKPIILKRKWWNSVYESARFHNIVNLVINKIGIEDFTILLYHPFGMNLVNRLKYKTLVFDAIDNFLKIQHFDMVYQEMSAQYKDILQKADKIICVSQDAKRNLFANTPKAVVITNGVNPEVFALHSPSHQIESLKNFRGLKIGYVGTMSDRLNVALLRNVAASLPDVYFFLVGPAVNKSDLNPVRELRNVFLTGNVHYSIVPSILRDFDICMIPHHVGLHEHDGDLMKFYEYIAAKKPIISTRVAGSERFAKYVMVVDDVEAFKGAINDVKSGALKAEYPSDILKRFTWRDKTDELICVLNKNGI